MIFSIFLLTMVFPVVMLPINLIMFVKDKRHPKIYAFLIAFGFAAIAFNFDPSFDQDTDLIRHYVTMHRTQNHTFLTAMQSDAFASLMGYYVLLKIFSFAKMPVLLPTFITFIGYYILVYMVSKWDVYKNSFNRFVTVYLLLASVSFLGFCSGIRQYTVFVIFLLTFYMETKNSKLKALAFVIYFLLLTLHASLVLIIALRLFVEVAMHFKKIKLLAFLVLFWGAIQTYVLEFIGRFFGGNIFAEAVLDKYEYYQEHASAVIVPNYIWRFLMLMLCLYVVTRLNKRLGDYEVLSKKYLLFCQTLCVFSIGAMANYDIFARFSIFTIMFVIPLLPTFFKTIQAQRRGFVHIGIMLFASAILVYNITQYTAFSFKSFEEIFSTSIFSILGGI